MGQETLVQNQFVDMGYFWDIAINISDSIYRIVMIHMMFDQLWKYLKTSSCIETPQYIEIHEEVFTNCYL